MILTAISFPLSVFEAGWAFFFNFFIWHYIFTNIKDIKLSFEAHYFKRLLLFPILVVGYVTIAVYIFIILAALLVVGAGYFTGYWVFDRKKGEAYNDHIDHKENRKVTVKLTPA
jgi:fatty acid desaturase